ncbi:Uncharacterised protein r2_g2061 [Pycnogonum litorale]
MTDVDYADDLAVLADVLKDATFLLHSIERTSKEIGFYLNADKTEFICLNQDASEGMKSLNGDKIKQVEDFRYLGSYIATTAQDVNIRLGKAWGALNQLNKIWKSNLPDNLKRNFFRATVESVLVYGSVSWILTTQMEKKIDGAYTRMLRSALNRSWKDHPTNKELYGNIPPISKSIKQQRMRFVGHCWRSKEELIGDVLLWKPSYGKQSAGRPKKTYIDQMMDDTGCRLEELPNAMEDRERWKKRVMDCRASST